MPPLRSDEPRRPAFLDAWGIPAVYAVAVLARSSIIIVIPTLAYRNLGDAGTVSAVYLLASVLGLMVSMSFPFLLQSFGTWRLMICAAAMGVSAAMLFCLQGTAALIAGLSLHLLMVQLFETTINLYALSAVSRKDLARFEPRRVMLAGVTYMAGPFIGAFLLEYGPFWSAFALSGLCAALVPAIMLGISPAGLHPVPPAAPGGKRGFAVRQFLRQPRLRLAWLLATGRAGWWQTFFVYTPILAATAGIGVAHTGTIAGAASALLLLAPLWGMAMRALGMRRFLFVAYAVCGVATAGAGLLAEWFFGWAATALIVASVAISGVDSAGNAPFMRAVKSRDRLRMVPIYNTYREMSQIIPTAVYTLTLMVFGVSSVFVLSGIALALLSLFCLKLPRRA